MGKMTITKGQRTQLSPAQVRELDELEKRPINYDDIPKFSREELAEFKRVNPLRKKNKSA